MKFREIARFLNISETVARSPGKQEMLPGRPCADGWETTFDELERWYVRLSGKEWATHFGFQVNSNENTSTK